MKRKQKRINPSAAPVRRSSGPQKAAPPKPASEDDSVETDPEDVPPVKDEPRTSRRDFLARTGQILVGACGVASVAGAARLALPNVDDRGARRFRLGVLSDFKMNTLTWLRERDLFVSRDEQGIGAFSSKCTHLGCTVQRTDFGFLCPCHGARYDPIGTVIRGPAAAPLPWYPVVLYPDGRLWVHLDEPRETAGPTALLTLKETPT